MVMSLLYWILRRVLELLVARGRPDNANEIELLVLRHELTVLRRQVGRPRFRPADRAMLAALARLLSKGRWPSLLVRPETVRRWHRAALARRWTYPRRRPGRPPLGRAMKELIVRLAKENPTWGHRRVHGEPARLGVKIAPSTVWQVFRDRPRASTSLRELAITPPGPGRRLRGLRLPHRGHGVPAPTLCLGAHRGPEPDRASGRDHRRPDRGV
ncbi:MAG: helix-turn-helix domain-containing protein, partial [Actinomycetota bacterium]